mmetsp:Transcript_16847/g.25337  ORF Transcript_16847/g.25337 Transcript_16847/m.25337 type:complete len:757 (-) Transcript_16847:91-2361(-)
MAVKRLSRADLEEVTGLNEFDDVEDLEILFNSFNELYSLDGFPKLKRLCCIDNGINRISNLEPVSATLLILNLSDQDITRIENLHLPNLRELFLHRNCIRSMDGLDGVPRLKKLWLCQNQISTIGDMQSVPELEELWLQGNSISSLQGLECLYRLSHLSIAGNLVSSFAELRRLSSLAGLTTLCCQDIHFGRCPVADCEGYKEFVLCHLKQVVTIDGVATSAQALEAAQASHANEVMAFNAMIQEMENSHQQELQSILHKQQARTSHSTVLEREMQDALGELERLVMDGRGAIGKQIKRQQDMLQKNIADLHTNVEDVYASAVKKLERAVDGTKKEYDTAESIFYTLEMVTLATECVLEALCSVASQATSSHSYSSSSMPVIHHPISDNTPDFQSVSKIFSTTGKHGSDAIQPLGLIKLHRVSYKAKQKDETKQRKSQVEKERKSLTRAFTVVRADQLMHIIRDGWNSIQDTVVFCTVPGVAAALHLPDGGSDIKAVNDLQHMCQAGGSDIAAPLLEDSEMDALVEARKMQPLIVLSCNIDLEQSGIKKHLEGPHGHATIRIPSTDAARREMMRELRKARKAVGVEIDHGMGWMYALPFGDSRDRNEQPNSPQNGVTFSSSIIIEYVCLCTSPPIEGGIKGLEQKLEIMMMPSRAHSDWLGKSPSGSDSSSFLSEFDEQIHGEVRKYVDQVLEELEEEQANTFRAADDEMLNKESMLRSLKEELAQERRVQEGLLKDMRGAHGSSSSKQSKGHSGR